MLIHKSEDSRLPALRAAVNPTKAQPSLTGQSSVFSPRSSETPPPFSLARELEALQRAVAARDAAPPPPKPVPLRHRILAQVPQGMINALSPEAICDRLEGISLSATKHVLAEMFHAAQVKRIGRCRHFFYHK